MQDQWHVRITWLLHNQHLITRKWKLVETWIVENESFIILVKHFFLIIHLISVTIQQQLLKRIHVVKCTYGFLEVKQKFCSDKEIITKTVFKVLPKDFAQSSEFNWRFYMNLFLSFFLTRKYGMNWKKSEICVSWYGITFLAPWIGTSWLLYLSIKFDDHFLLKHSVKPRTLSSNILRLRGYCQVDWLHYTCCWDWSLILNVDTQQSECE